MNLTKEQALQKVKDYIPESIILKSGMVVKNLLIVTDDLELNETIISKYKSKELTPEEVAELYGNGQNLRLYGVGPEF